MCLWWLEKDSLKNIKYNIAKILLMVWFKVVHSECEVNWNFSECSNYPPSNFYKIIKKAFFKNRQVFIFFPSQS